MPRKSGSTNSSNFHYKVKKYADSSRQELLETNYFKTQKDIAESYGINRSSIYFIINPDDTRLSRKWKDFDIEKLSPPVPIYEKVERDLFC